MKKYFLLFSIFLVSFFLYFGIATDFTFKPKWALDYLNPLAYSLLHFKIDLPNPSATYDLAYYNGKWYAPWGILPALFIVPLQLIMGRFVPILYLTLFFANLEIVLLYLLLSRLKKEFFPNLTQLSIISLLILYAFGTTHVYVGTLGSTWHVVQMVSNFFGTAGIYIIFRKKRTLKDYFFSACLFSVALLGRTTIVFLMLLPLVLFIFDYLPSGKRGVKRWYVFINRLILIFGSPLAVMISMFFLYNFVRFKSPLEYGFSFIREAPYLAELRQTYGALSIRNIPRNLWLMIAEIPSLTYQNKPTLAFNLKGNSIFFLTPPFLAIFLASWIQKRKDAAVWNPYITALWIAIIGTTIPSLMHYSSGWMQFGYRYTLDVTMLLLILSVFGMNGKLNTLFFLGILFSIIIYQIGIRALG